MKNEPDDSFELYDLRVEVTAPPGGNDLLRRQARRLFRAAGARCCICRPARASRSIRWPRCCRCCRPSSARPHPNDWMTTDAEIACPDPNCPTRFRISRTGKRRFSHAAVTAVPLAGGASRDRRRTIRASAGLRDLARHPRRLAACRRPRRGRPAPRSTTSRCLREAGITTFDCADIYTGVEELIGAARAEIERAPRRGERAARIKVHTKFVPDLEHARRRSTAPISARSSTRRCGGCARSGSTSCSSTGGTMPSRR